MYFGTKDFLRVSHDNCWHRQRIACNSSHLRLCEILTFWYPCTKIIMFVSFLKLRDHLVVRLSAWISVIISDSSILSTQSVKMSSWRLVFAISASFSWTVFYWSSRMTDFVFVKFCGSHIHFLFVRLELGFCDQWRGSCPLWRAPPLLT